MMGMGWRLVHAVIYTCWGQRTLLLDGLILIFYIYIDLKNQIESVSRFVQKVLYFQTSLVAQYFLCLNIALACFIVVAFHFFLQNSWFHYESTCAKCILIPFTFIMHSCLLSSSNCSPIFQMVTLLFQFLKSK